MSADARDTSFFDSIKELVSLEQYATEHLGVEFVSDGAMNLKACCPFHAERTPSFYVKELDQKPWQVWQCFGGCKGTDIDHGTVIDAVMRREGFDEPMDAAQWLNEEFDLGLQMDNESYQRFNEVRKEARARIEKSQETLASGEDRAAKAARNYFEGRGYTEETAKHFGLGVDTEFSKAGRLSIPLIDKENHPVSTDGRALFDGFNCRACGEYVTAKKVHERLFDTKKRQARNEPVDFDWTSCPHCEAPDAEARIKWLSGQYPKYRFAAKFDKSRFLYHQFEARKALVKDGRLPLVDQKLLGYVLVEGYADCWAGYQAGQQAISSYNGAVLSDWQAKQVIEVAKAGSSPKPVILSPDMDATGRLNVGRNIHKLRSVDPNIEIQVIFGIDEYTYQDKDGVQTRCKDLGDVLQYLGAETLTRLLHEGRRPAEEWLIREILDAKLEDGTPFHSKVRQMDMISEILKGVRHKAGLDHLIPLLGQHWQIQEREARGWFQKNHATSVGTSHQHLIANMDEAQEEALIFLRDGSVIPFGYAAIDRCLPRGGVRRGWLSMFLGKSGTGKSQPLDAKVLTPTGWRLMGDLVVGDQVVNPATGGAASIVAVHPQGERDIYRVTFSDGSSTECDREHLWKVRDSNQRWQVRELGRLIDRVDLSKSPHRIPLVAPIDFADARAGERTVDPYLLGLLLGDADVTGNLIYSSEDPELIQELRERLPAGVVPKKIQGDNCMWGLTAGYKTSIPNPLTVALRVLGLMGSRSETKFVPEAYKLGSAQARLELLRGLMDTDGSVCKQTKNPDTSVCAEFCSASEQLATDVVYLIRSLGGSAVISDSASSYRGEDGNLVDCQRRYRVSVAMPSNLNPFKLERKASLWKRQVEPSRRMVAIELVGRKQAQCIALDSEQKLYVTDDFIVTHNTMMGTQMLANMAENGTRAIFFSLEQQKGSLYVRIACQVLEKSPAEVEELILSADPGNEEVEEKDKLEAQLALTSVNKLFENMYIVDNVPGDGGDHIEMSAEAIEAIVREINMTHFQGAPADVVIIDHLGILKPGPDAPGNVQNDELQSAGYIMQELFHVCKQTQVFMLVMQQLPKETPAGVWFPKDAGRGGSKQTDYCDLIFGAYRPEQESALEDDEKAARKGQYKLALLKNRHGAEEIAHLMFDSYCLRIVPAARVPMPTDDISDAPRVEVPEGEQIAHAGTRSETATALLAGLDEGPGAIDTSALAASLGLAEEDPADTGASGDGWEWS